MCSWDEAAKVAGLKTPDLRSYAEKMAACLHKALWADRHGFSAATLVTAALKTQLVDRGYVVLRQFLTESEAAVLPAYCEYVAALKAGTLNLGLSWWGGKHDHLRHMFT